MRILTTKRTGQVKKNKKHKQKQKRSPSRVTIFYISPTTMLTSSFEHKHTSPMSVQQYGSQHPSSHQHHSHQHQNPAPTNFNRNFNSMQNFSISNNFSNNSNQFYANKPNFRQPQQQQYQTSNRIPISQQQQQQKFNRFYNNSNVNNTTNNNNKTGGNSGGQSRNELTINLTNNEPRLVIYNNQNKQKTWDSAAPSQIRSAQSAKFAQNFHHNNANSNSHQHYHHHARNNQSNRFKFFKPYFNLAQAAASAAQTHAPYNTTQYIMYDYSKRRGPLKDQVCPNEQQQFTDDWNLALTQAQQEQSSKAPKSNTNTNNGDEMDHDGNDADGPLKQSRSETDLTESSSSLQHDTNKLDLDLNIQQLLSTSI